MDDGKHMKPPKDEEYMESSENRGSTNEQDDGTYLTAQSPELVLKKLSMLSKPNRVQGIVPNLEDEDGMRALGMEKIDGKWYVPVHNREWFPDSVGADSIIVDYGVNDDGAHDIGFCNKDEFSKIYADAGRYDEGDISYLDTTEMPAMQAVPAVKCATGEFAIMPAGAKLATNEGNVEVVPGKVVVINENANSVYLSDVSEVLKRYVEDPLNPASSEVFSALRNYNQDDTSEENFNKLVEAFDAADRNKKAYRGDNEETLRQSFQNAAKIVDELRQEIGVRIDALSFDERLVQAQDILQEIESSDMSTIEKQRRAMYLMVHLLPKTNNHQHLKGSVPIETTLRLAKAHNFSVDDIDKIRAAYADGEVGFDDLNQFNDSYGAIGRAIRTPNDYREAVGSIITEAARSGQVSVEIRCSVIGQRDENGQPIDPADATENILKAMDDTCQSIGENEAPATGFVFLGYRGRDWHPEEVIEHARLAVEFAKKYPNRCFGFDVAGPEDTGYGPKAFEEAYRIIREYNQRIDSGEIKGEPVGITTHAGETPTFDGGRDGYESIKEALEMGVTRIGHGVQAVRDENTLSMLKRSGATVEICGVCNINSIPINTQGMAIHPVQVFISRGVPVTFCTDNDAICGTDITKEYAQFLLSGHSEVMNWNTVKLIASQGIKTSFISESDRRRLVEESGNKVRRIEKLITPLLESLVEQRSKVLGKGAETLSGLSTV